MSYQELIKKPGTKSVTDFKIYNGNQIRIKTILKFGTRTKTESKGIFQVLTKTITKST